MCVRIELLAEIFFRNILWLHPGAQMLPFRQPERQQLRLQDSAEIRGVKGCAVELVQAGSLMSFDLAEVS